MNSQTVLRITILVDNVSPDDALKAEHGFSCLVETGSHRVLFDTGAESALAHNTRALGLNLSELDALVFSHGHYDHTGGLPAVAAELGPVRVVAHPNILGVHRSRRTGSDRDIGIPDDSRIALNRLKCEFTQVPVEVTPGIWTTGAVPRSTKEGDSGELFADPAGTQPDLVPDDAALIVRHQAGLVVILGCAHAGVANTIEWAEQLFPGVPLLGVLGGMHLDRAAPDEIHAVVSRLLERSVRFISPGHCTGKRAMQALRVAFGERYLATQVGMQLSMVGDGELECRAQLGGQVQGSGNDLRG